MIRIRCSPGILASNSNNTALESLRHNQEEQEDSKNMETAAASTVGGYCYNFIEPPPKELLCVMCSLVARDPQQLLCCGKLSCAANHVFKRARHAALKLPSMQEEGSHTGSCRWYVYYSS